MTGVPLTLPSSNWTNLILNLSLNLDRDQGQSGDPRNILNFRRYGNSLNQAQASRSKSEDGDWGSCRDWQDAQHTLFQLANVCAAVSILIPTSFRHHLLSLRCILLVAFLFFVLWAGLFVCMMDVLVWNCVFFLVDLVHIVCLAYHTIPIRVTPSLHELYTKRFKPLRVTRKEFADLCSLGHIVPIRKGTRYASEGVTACGEKISILLRGRLKVSHNNVFLHCVEPNEFIDSVEFDSVPFLMETSEHFQVTVTAIEDSLLLSWLYPTLQELQVSHQPFMWAIFRGLIGKDISDKLYRIQELLLKEPEVMLGSAPSTPRPPALMHNARKQGGPSSASLTPRTPRRGDLPAIVPRRRSSQPDMTLVTQVPPQTTLNHVESFV